MHIKARHFFSILLLPALFASSASMSDAQSVWNGSNGDFNTGTNWTPNGVPSLTTSLSISSGTATDSSSAYLDRSANTTISGTGGLTLTNTRFVNANTGNATVAVSGNGSLTQTGQYFVVANAYTGAVNQSGGTVTANVTSGFFLSDNAGSSGTYNLTGGTLDVNASGSLAGGATYGVNFGKNSGSDVFDVNGGTANFEATGTSGDVRTYISSGAKLQVDSGTATFDNFRYITIGRNAGGTSPSQVIVNNGGTLNFTNLNSSQGASGISVGNGAAGQLTLNSGGTINVTGNAASGAGLWLGDAASTTGSPITGTFIENGGKLSLNIDVVLSRAANSQGIYNMFGGELDALSITTGAGINPEFDFQGGNIYLTGNQTSIITDSWFQGAAGTTDSYNSQTNQTHIFIAAATPEPGSLGLGLLSLAAFALIRHRIRRAI